MDSWVSFPKPNLQARRRLFCFPYAGGSAALFHAWPKALPKSVEVCPIQLPGRGSRLRESPFTSLTSLVQVLAEAIWPHLDRPFAFFGHSMGALISFELARQLRRQYERLPFHLFVSAHRAPQLPALSPVTYNLPETEFIEELRRLNGTPAEVLAEPELMQLLLPVLRADFALCQTYIYSTEPPLDCSITCFGGLEDHEVSRERLEAWRYQTTNFFSLKMLPGDHFFCHTAAPLLLRVLSEELGGPDA